ncbi:MAG TPA: hypothetical protein VN843_23420 [Anaerolineales bacterium]|nr:hypothetical protein [Anaerolineales bacterium]
MRSNGEEVITIANPSYLVGRARKYFQAVGLRSVQVTAITKARSAGSTNTSPVFTCSAVGSSLKVSQQLPFTIATNLILLGGGKRSAPRPSGYQDAYVHATGTTQSYNVSERVAFHS